LALEPLKQIKQTSRAWRTYDEELLSGVVVTAIVAVAWSARSQSSTTTQGQSTQQNASGTGGPSQPGVSGLPGSKSGPTVTRSGTTAPEATRSQPSGDQIKVQGLPGSKSGPTVKPSDGQVSGLRHSKLDQPAIWNDERPSQLPQPGFAASIRQNVARRGPRRDGTALRRKSSNRPMPRRTGYAPSPISPRTPARDHRARS
jgi:hypothetical protein